MCPVCLLTALLIAGSVTSSGGLAAIAIRKFSAKNAEDPIPAPNPSPIPSPIPSKEDRHGQQHN